MGYKVMEELKKEILSIEKRFTNATKCPNCPRDSSISIHCWECVSNQVISRVSEYIDNKLDSMPDYPTMYAYRYKDIIKKHFKEDSNG
jgi:hypothetical protein